MIKAPLESALEVVDLADSAITDGIPVGYRMTELGLLPEEWQVTELGALVPLHLGRTPSRSNPDFWLDGSVPWVSIADLKNRRVSVTRERISQRAFQNVFRGNHVPIGSILMSFKLTIGKLGILTVPAVHNEAIVSLLPGNDLDRDFLFYLLQATDFSASLDAYVKGKTLNKEKLERILLPLPPLPEQRAIAHVLSTLQRAREATEAVIAATRELKRSLMRHLFTYGPVPVDVVDGVRQKETEIGFVPEHWKMRPVGEMFEVQLGKMLSPKARTGRNPMEYLRNQDVRWGSVNVSRLPTMDFDSREVQKFSLRTGDILVCEGGEIGRTAVWRGELAPCSYQKAIHRLRPINGEVLPQYFAFHMMNAFLLSNVYGDTGTTTTIAHLPAVKLRSLPLSVPPIGEQHQIANMLSSVDEKLTLEESRKASLDALFHTLLHDLMTGKLRVSPDAANPTG